jgi:hypothetical protein
MARSSPWSRRKYCRTTKTSSSTSTSSPPCPRLEVGHADHEGQRARPGQAGRLCVQEEEVAEVERLQPRLAHVGRAGRRAAAQQVGQRVAAVAVVSGVDAVDDEAAAVVRLDNAPAGQQLLQRAARRQGAAARRAGGPGGLRRGRGQAQFPDPLHHAKAAQARHELFVHLFYFTYHRRE